MNKILLLHNGSELSEYKVTGGGGTDFNCNWEYMKEMIYFQKVPNVYRWLSWDSWGDDNYCDTVFVSRPPRQELTGTIWYHLSL